MAPVDRSGRSDVATAAGLSAATAGVVGAFALAGRVLSRRSDKQGEQDEQGTEGERGRADRRSSGPRHGDAPSGSSDDDSAQSARRRAQTAPDPDAPSKPEGPEDLHKPTLLYSLKKTASEFGADQCTDIAASLVYYSVLALGPAIVAIVSILGLLSPSTVQGITGQVLAPIRQSSEGTYNILSQLVTTASSAPGAGVGLVVGILGALWSASGYIGAFGRAMNRIYSIPEGRPIWKLRPTQLLITLVVVILVVVGAVLLISTGWVVKQLADGLGIGDVPYLIFQIVKWPILVLLAIAGIAILYYFSPNIRQPKFKWTSTGSLLALIVWAIATAGLGIYLSVSGGGSYAKTYGPVAGVIIFLLWLWLTNLALLFGAEFDAELERSRELQAGMAAEEQIQLPPRDTRQSDKKAEKHEKQVEQAKRLRESRGRSD